MPCRYRFPFDARRCILKALVIYVPTMGLVFFLVFLSGFIDPLAKQET
ncbi:MAG: hypothetical protein MR425_08985 [Lachnospiraceae bacterium]|nr:hypothetical protein [Lachnospiraceae bacterium]